MYPVYTFLIIPKHTTVAVISTLQKLIVYSIGTFHNARLNITSMFTVLFRAITTTSLKQHNIKDLSNAHSNPSRTFKPVYAKPLLLLLSKALQRVFLLLKKCKTLQC